MVFFVLFLGLAQVTARGTDEFDFTALRLGCPKLLEFESEYRLHIDARVQAARAFPRSALQRGHELRRLVGEQQPEIAERLLGYDKNNKVTYRGMPYTKLVVEEAPEVNSVRFRPAAGRVPAKARVIVPLMHGTGATWSHSGAMLQALHFLTSEKSGGGFFSALTARGNRFPIAAEVVDQPGAGAGPDANEYRNLDRMVEWFDAWLAPLRATGKPIVPVGRSGMGGFLPYYDMVRPGVLAGMILLSPEHPDPSIGLEFSGEQMYRELVARQFIPNLIAFDWMVDMHGQISRRGRYFDRDLPFGRTPTCLLFGEKDTEISPAARDVYRGYVARTRAAGLDTAHLHVFPRAGHDVFANNATTDPATPVEAYNFVLWFLRAHILRDPALPAVEPTFTP